MNQIERDWRNSSFYADKIASKLQGNEILLNVEYNELKKQYDELLKDPVVTAALEELNKNPGPRVVVGSEEDYWVNVQKMHEGLLIRRGLFPTRDRRGRGLEAVEDRSVKELWVRTEASDKALQKALKTQKQERIEEISRQKHLAEWPRTLADLNRKIDMARTPVEKLGLTRKLKTEKDLIEKDQQMENQAEETRKKRSQEVAVKRKAFVENVAALDKAVDASRKRSEDLANNSNVQQASKALNRPIVSAISKDLDKHLVAAKKRIKTEQIKLDPDKAIFWVDVILNENKEPTKMVIDPGVDVIRFSEGFAAGLGIRPLDTDPMIDVATGDGQTFSARRIKLKRVRVGSFKINDVDCLVFSKGYETSPLLGASFLDHFSFELDAGEAKLILTKVEEPH